MKKKVLIPGLTLVCVLLLAPIVYFTVSSGDREQTDLSPDVNNVTDRSDKSFSQVTESVTDGEKVKGPDKADKISAEKAMGIALENAGFSENEVWDKDVDLDYEKGRLVYEVSFVKDYVEYDYIIEPAGGEILHSENDVAPSTVAHSQQAQEKTTASSESRITAKQARKIALENAGFSENEVWDKEAELDYENGVLVYEVSFEKNNIDYEYIINAQSGEIIRSEVDPY